MTMKEYLQSLRVGDLIHVKAYGCDTHIGTIHSIDSHFIHINGFLFEFSKETGAGRNGAQYQILLPEDANK